MGNNIFKVKKGLVLLLGLLLFNSCQPDEKQQLINRVNNLEKELFENKKGVVDTKDAANIIHCYLQFADKYPNDTLSPDYLFKAADVSVNVFHSRESVRLFTRVITEYPKYDKTPQALFLKAFTFENYLGEIDSAKIYYQSFIAQYPNHPFTNDAQISLQNLGKSPEEIIKGFKVSKQK